MAVMTLGALRGAASSTGEFTNEVTLYPDLTSALAPEEAQMVFTRKKSLAELTRHLVSHSGDEAALSAVCTAVRDGGHVEELVALLESCSNAAHGPSLPDHAMAELSFRIAKGSTGAHARELCRTALDLCPVHVAALSLFEELSDASWTDELCARYQIFLEDAPSHGVSPEVCEAVTNKLVEAEREAVLQHEDLDIEHHQGLCSSPKSAFACVVYQIDGVAEWQSAEVLTIQA